MISPSNLIQKNRAIFSYLASRWRGTYTFSRNDLFLYLNERYHIQSLPIVVISHHDNDLTQLEIGGRRIFWPSTMTCDELSWLFGEIFAPWSGNPSSYDHPAMEIGKAEWIVDAGACEGFFSLFALEQGARRVVAVEPLGPLWQALQKTFADHTDAGRFTLFEGALGKATGTTYLNIDPQHVCDSAVDSAGSGLSVSQISLDELGERYNLETGGMIKMDIEGAEMDTLQGGALLLREHKPKLAVAVYHGYENAQRCKEIILKANPDYTIEFRGMYGWFSPPRPYLLFAW
jgi:FkbM family methyltransferase